MAKKRILILVADAGFGHISAARAVAAALEEMHPQECQIDIVNPLLDRRVPILLRNSGKDYDRLVNAMPRLWKLEYEVSDSTPSSAMVNSAMSVLLFEVMSDLVKKYRPDVIVTPYFLYQSPLETVFSLTQRDIPLLTVVTDLAPVHRLWFHKTDDLCMVSMPAVRDQALEAGLAPQHVAVTGIPIHPDFVREKRSKSALRKELGWLTDRKTFIAIGSKRVKNMTALLRALNHSGLPLQLALVAGGDEDLYRQLQQTEWHLPVHLYNFVDNMPAMMRAADAVICKAGGLVVTESLACGLPILLTEAIAGQETSNARYVVEGGAGVMVKNPLDGLETVFHWLADDGQVLRRVSRNAEILGYPRAAYDAASLIWAAAGYGAAIKTDRRFLELIDRFIRRLQKDDIF